MSQIPDDIAEVVRRAAGTASACPSDVREIRRRGRRHQRRRTATVMGGTAALALAGVLAAPTVLGTTSGPPSSTAGPGTATGAAGATEPGPAPAQRILLGGGGISISVPAPSQLDDQGPHVAELLPDALVVHHRLPQLDGWNRILAPSEGGLVGLGYDLAGSRRPDTESDAASGAGSAADRNGSAGVPRDVESGSSEHLARLVVLGPNGAVTWDRTVGDPGEQVRLVAATARTAFLWRTTGLVEHDLASGRERLALAANALDETPDVLPPDHTDVRGGKLVIAGVRAACELRVVDLVTGRSTGVRAVRSGCGGVTAVRISSDGTRAAVGYQRATTAGSGPGIAVVDLTSGEVLADVTVGGLSGPDAAVAPKQPIGMAWADDTRIRVALTKRAEPDGTVRPEDIRQEIFTVR